MELNLIQNKDFHLSSKLSNVEVHLDADEKIGGTNKGCRPTEMLLTSLASCSAMDVIHILRKRKANYSDFKINIKAERREEIPKIFEKIYLTCSIKSEEVTQEQLQKWFQISIEKYCTVAAMLSDKIKIIPNTEVF